MVEHVAKRLPDSLRRREEAIKHPGLSWEEVLVSLGEEQQAAKSFIAEAIQESDSHEAMEEMQNLVDEMDVVRAGWIEKTARFIRQKKRAHVRKRIEEKENPKNRYAYLVHQAKHISHTVHELRLELSEQEERRANALVRAAGVSEDILIGDSDLGEYDLLMREPGLIEDIQEVVEIVLSKSSNVDRAADHLHFFSDTVSRTILPNLVQNGHQGQALDLWNVMDRVGLRRRPRFAYYEKDSREEFIQRMSEEFLRESGVTTDGLKDDAKRTRVAERIENGFAHRNQEFFAACVIQTPAIFPRWKRGAKGVELSDEYKAILGRLLDRGDKTALVRILCSITDVTSHVDREALREGVVSIDASLKRGLFEACLNEEGIDVLIPDWGLFENETQLLDRAGKKRIISLIKNKPDLFDIYQTGLFAFLHRLSLSPEEEQEILQCVWKTSNESLVAACLGYLSSETQLYLVSMADTPLLVSIADNLSAGHYAHLPAAIANHLIEEGFVEVVAKRRHAFTDLPEAMVRRLDACEVVIRKIAESPSRTVRRMKEVLMQELGSSPDPEKAYERVEAIFLRNHIPLAGKIFFTYEVVYGDRRLKDAYSPILRAAAPREARMLIYKDLLNIHLDTNNSSLRQFLQGIQEMLPILERIQSREKLNPDDERKAERFFREIEVLHEVSLYHKLEERDGVGSVDDFADRLSAWMSTLGVREGQSLHQRLEEMFLKPAGVSSIGAALTRMDASVEAADRVNREFASHGQGKIRLQEGDLLKGVESKYFQSYQQRGNVAKEFLGYAAAQDATALDTDVSRVLWGDTIGGVERTVRQSLTKDYGDLVLVMRPTSDRFVQTTTEGEVSIWDQIRGKTAPYELFQVPVLDRERHYAIRTGVPFTEVRCILMRKPGRRELLDLKMDIVANGYYVMIADLEGDVLFPPEEFDQLRILYAGSEVAPHEVPLVDQHSSDEYKKELDQIVKVSNNEVEVIRQIQYAIHHQIVQALNDLGVVIRRSGELAVGAEILHVGSTARQTNIPGEKIDFDITIRLDESDLSKQSSLVQKLDQYLPGQVVKGANTQWRRSDVELFGKRVDIDIAFTPKPEVEGIPSHTMVEQRLGSVARMDPEKAKLARANIILAKQILKKAGVYKKLDGGLGGLGVENWILQSGGSFERARKEFLDAAIDERGKIRPFEKFAQRYAVPDPGVNLIERLDQGSDSNRISYRHDNFVYFLDKEGIKGYTKMVHALR